jgi:hypothetical protein
MKRFRSLAIEVLVLAIGGMAPAAILSIDFDGAGYIAGQHPPLPWRDNSPNLTVGAGIGYLGTQGLVLSNNSNNGAVCDLSAPLTSDMGAVTIEVLFNPQGYSWNYGGLGGITLMGGDPLAHGGVYFDYSAGKPRIRCFHKVGYDTMVNTTMGSFTNFQWYQITINIDEGWENITFNVGPVGGTMLSATKPYNGSSINRFHFRKNDDSPRVAIYDNLSVIAIPACPSADLTDDCFVDMADFAVIAQWWLDNCDVSNNFCDGADFQSFGQVTVDDLLTVALQWLQGEQIQEPE